MAADQQTGEGFASKKATLFATALAIASFVTPFWFWMDTWFGKELSDEQVQKCVPDTERPRPALGANHRLTCPETRSSVGDTGQQPNPDAR